MSRFLKCVVISTLCVVLIASTSAMFFANAYEYEGDKYLSDEIIDIAEGHDETLGEINNFDRYERAYELNNALYGSNYQVKFQAGGEDHTHQYICANALRVLANDKGGCLLTDSANSAIIVENADWPDKNDIGFIFDTHFYNPVSETNYHGGETTAKVKAGNYYNEAIEAYKSGNLTLALQKIGRGSHFCADACEAHHATNKTAVGSNHSAYEKYIDTIRSKCAIPNNSFGQSVYNEALYLSVGQIVRNNSYSSYCLGDRVTGSESNPDYEDAGVATVRNGIMSTTQYFYKFAVETGMLSA